MESIGISGTISILLDVGIYPEHHEHSFFALETLVSFYSSLLSRNDNTPLFTSQEDHRHYENMFNFFMESIDQTGIDVKVSCVIMTTTTVTMMMMMMTMMMMMMMMMMTMMMMMMTMMMMMMMMMMMLMTMMMMLMMMMVFLIISGTSLTLLCWSYEKKANCQSGRNTGG
jgi:hypothetical protein